MGVSLHAVNDFLHHVDWPDCYKRSSDLCYRNGDHVRGKETGYDLVTHIRTLLEEKELEDLSVAELLQVNGHAGVSPKADAFFSHAQSEQVTVTVAAIAAARVMMWRQWRWHGPTFFVDYFVLRQCQPNDFSPRAVNKAIGEIRHLVLMLDPPGDNETDCGPETLKRLWCCFEMACATKQDANITGVFTITGFFRHDPDNMADVHVEKAEANRREDQTALKEFLLKNNLSFHDVNDRVSKAVQRAAKTATMTMSTCVAACATATAFLSLAVTTGGIVATRVIKVALICASLGLPVLAAGLVESWIPLSSKSVMWKIAKAFWLWWLTAGMLACLWVVEAFEDHNAWLMASTLPIFSVTLPAVVARKLRSRWPRFGRTVIRVGPWRLERVQVYVNVVSAAVYVVFWPCLGLARYVSVMGVEGLRTMLPEFSLLVEIALMPTVVALAATAQASHDVQEEEHGSEVSEPLSVAWAVLAGVGIAGLPAVTVMTFMLASMYKSLPFVRQLAIILHVTLLILRFRRNRWDTANIHFAVVLAAFVASSSYGMVLCWLYKGDHAKLPANTKHFKEFPNFWNDFLLRIYVPLVLASIMPFAAMGAWAKWREHIDSDSEDDSNSSSSSDSDSNDC